MLGKRWFRVGVLQILFFLFLHIPIHNHVNALPATITGELRLWHPITITFDGPLVNENSNPNPFLDYRLDVTFTNGATTLVVPGYYAADGNAANTSAASGNKWQVQFMPTKVGNWNYEASFRSGTNVAVSDVPLPGVSGGFFDGETGNFIVQDTNKSGKDFKGRGLLEYVGEHYMRFAGDGTYFLKHGAGSPENFLGYAEFDGTYDIGGCCVTGLFLHEYTPHIGDWTAGDPQWSGNRGRGIIGAINYLSSQNVNSMYIITYNIDEGDGQDVWPWIDDTSRDRFDVSKLGQWGVVFGHMNTMGIQAHLLLSEVENALALGGLTTERRLYYREMVARFAHNPVIQWNLGEENNNPDADKILFSNYIRSLDPYNHPITVHSFWNLQTNADAQTYGTYYNNLLGADSLEAASMQGWVSNFNQWARELRQKSTNAGKPWVLYSDEQKPEVDPQMGNIDFLIRDGTWGSLLGGGAGSAWYFGYQPAFNFGDIESENYRDAELLWQRGSYAIDFFQQYLPFWEMEPEPNLINNNPLVFAKAGEVYTALLSPTELASDVVLDLGSDGTIYDIHWYNIQTGGALSAGTVAQIVADGTSQSIGTPTSNLGQDWVVLFRANDSVTNSAPVSVDDTYTMSQDTTLTISDTTLGILNNDTDANDDVLTAIKQTDPVSGSLTLNLDGTFEFVPATGFIGDVTFNYLANDGSLDSNIAIVTVTVTENSNNNNDDDNETLVETVREQAQEEGVNILPALGRIDVFDPALSKIGLLLPGQLGVNGEQLEWIVTVRNNSGVPGVKVVVSDTLRDELRINGVQVTSGPGTSSVNSQTVTVNIPTLNPGEVTQFSIFTTVVRGGATVDNTAILTADNLDGQPRTATASVITTLPLTGESLWSAWRPLILILVAGVLPFVGVIFYCLNSNEYDGDEGT